MYFNHIPCSNKTSSGILCSIWSTHWVQDIKLVEGVQPQATKLVPELKHLPYVEILKRLRLRTLEERRTRGDLIEMYKIIT